MLIPRSKLKIATDYIGARIDNACYTEDRHSIAQSVGEAVHTPINRIVDIINIDMHHRFKPAPPEWYMKMTFEEAYAHLFKS